jgi:hypothetical protein
MSVPAMAAEVTAARAVPSTTSSTPKLTANANPLNTPQVTGSITVPQAPSGAVVTNTGRTTSGTKAFLTLIGPQRGWNGVRNPVNAG